MITKHNFREVLTALGFEKTNNADLFSKTYSTCCILVDFNNETLIYPENKGLIVNDKTTSNFSHNENFVVFECVCRLLDKGYRPEHIELEPKWQLGRDAKSGKADIVVKDENGDTLIIIECKTAGTEYNKEVKNTEEYGGQLFSYWQQENATRWLALYAADWKDGDIVVKSQVINCTDDANIVKMADKDKDVIIYRNAHNDEERFKVWDETYNKSWIDNLIFDIDSQAYNIGIPPLRKNKLRDFTPEDKIVNRFEEILRHNNVSDKENAFNRLIALFICKLVDEIKKQDFEEVEFQYKQGTDTYETLQDRLQRLHTQGMEEFMKEKIFYVAADYAERLFMQYTGKKRKQAIEDLNNTIRILKFYSNNDFTFKDVHNEELFFQNGKILVEVVQLFQPYRIVYPSKHQFLGDLFEQLLNKGFKQNEGQFFTPTPITRFIWDSLPIQTYISEHGLPNVIDYACGAGHFLTEAVEAINAVRKNSENSWVEKHIYGVEKDYRLARVSKISMFMNGAGGANIIFGDGLENYTDKGIENGTFDILVANPPYSVSGFKSHLKLKNNKFKLLNVITNDGKEIETLFVERIAQLLRPQGLAAVILPASILSNSSNSYITARENLLKNFYIRAIVSFGSKTFGATGTNTVTLFLERYKEPPCIAKLTEDSVDAIMSGEDISEFKDKQILADYLQMQNVSNDIYLRFIHRDLGWIELTTDLYFKVYVNTFNEMAIALPKKCSEEEAECIRLEKFYDFALEVEKDKLYYFALVREQRTLVITAPSENSEQKLFLGYDWSNRKGAEGIIINTPGGKLYNQEDRFARGTLACAVRNSFAEADTILSDDLMKYAKHHFLKNMLDFSNNIFNKSIKITFQRSFMIKSKFELKKLGGSDGICDILIGGTPSRKHYEYFNGSHLWVSVGELNGQTITDTKEKITEEAIRNSNVKLVPAGTTLLSFKLSIGKTAIAGTDLYTNEAIASLIPKDKSEVLDKYLFYIFKGHMIDFTTGDKAFGKSLNSAYLNNEVKVPVPPIEIQKKIIAECEAIDAEYNTIRMTIETYRKKISDIFEKLQIVDKNRGGVKLSDLCLIKGGKRIPKGMIFCSYKTSHPYIRVVDFNNRSVNTENLQYIDENVFEKIKNYTISKDDVYISIAGTIGLVGRVPAELSGANLTENAAKLIIKDKTTVDADFLSYVMNTNFVQNQIKAETHAVGVPKLALARIANIKVIIPSKIEQQNILKTVHKYESLISEAYQVMQSCSKRKKALIEHYLFNP